MIRPEDVVGLPPGVRVSEHGLEDDVRGAVYPLNETARRALAADPAPIAAIADAIAREHGVAAEDVRRDLIRFYATQNARLLVDVRPRGRLLPRALALATRGLVPVWPRRRYPLRAAAWPLVRVALVAALPVALVTFAFARQPAHALASAAAVAAGLLAHEGGHAALLRGHAACLAVAGIRVAIVHRPLPQRRRALIAMAGPGAAAALGALVLLAAWIVVAAEVAVAGLLLAAHALALTVAAADGRAACGLS